MAISVNMKNIKDLLNEVGDGKLQLPEFQRSWVWDNSHICKLIESITSGFPMGAVMFLENGGDSAKFQYRIFSGVESTFSSTVPNALVLDGQQRLTTLYQVFKSQHAVETKDSKEKRFYYLDVQKCIDPQYDRLDAILSMPEKKVKTSQIGRKIDLDLSTREKELENLMFPLNQAFDYDDWQDDLYDYYDDTPQKPEIKTKWRDFKNNVIEQIKSYSIPVIELSKDTTAEAVCQIFENVNTGGITLTVFELVTAKFAASNTNLREEWNSFKSNFKKNRKDDLLESVQGSSFLQAMTLLVSYIKSRNSDTTVTCKKRDVLRLKVNDYNEYKQALSEGFMKAANFLLSQGIYTNDDIPYATQLTPLAAILTYDSLNGNKFHIASNKEKLSRWYWCGVFGELYGFSTETRFGLDIVNIFDWLDDENKIPDTVNRSNFMSTRLLTLQTRNSAAYKGVMALILQTSPLDFMSGEKMDLTKYIDEKTDIHHIFPSAYCENKFDKKKWNSVVNKTPIHATTNRSIGSRAPSLYIQTMQNKGLTAEKVNEALMSHFISPQLLRADNFNDFIIDRAKRLLDLIERATGKKISDRSSEEVINQFGENLSVVEDSLD